MPSKSATTARRVVGKDTPCRVNGPFWAAAQVVVDRPISPTVLRRGSSEPYVGSGGATAANSWRRDPNGHVVAHQLIAEPRDRSAGRWGTGRRPPRRAPGPSANAAANSGAKAPRPRSSMATVTPAMPHVGTSDPAEPGVVRPVGQPGHQPIAGRTRRGSFVRAGPASPASVGGVVGMPKASNPSCRDASASAAPSRRTVSSRWGVTSTPSSRVPARRVTRIGSQPWRPPAGRAGGLGSASGRSGPSRRHRVRVGLRRRPLDGPRQRRSATCWPAAARPASTASTRSRRPRCGRRRSGPALARSASRRSSSWTTATG